MSVFSVENITAYVAIYLFSGVKFIFGPTIGAEEDMSVLETAIFTSLGMMTSVIIFSFFGEKIRGSIRKGKKRRRLFSKKNRKIVRIYQRFGIKGIAFLTPLLLTPIGGTLIAVSFGVNKRKIILNMLPNAVIWSFVMSYIVIEFWHFFETLL